MNTSLFATAFQIIHPGHFYMDYLISFPNFTKSDSFVYVIRRNAGCQYA